MSTLAFARFRQHGCKRVKKKKKRKKYILQLKSSWPEYSLLETIPAIYWEPPLLKLISHQPKMPCAPSKTADVMKNISARVLVSMETKVFRTLLNLML